MGEFDYDVGGDEAPLGKMAKAEKCRPNFEEMIKAEREKESLMRDLYEATKAVVLSNHHMNLRTSKLKDLMGSLHVRLLLSSQAIDILIQKQENYED